MYTKAELQVLKRITPPARPPAVVQRTLQRVERALRAQQVLATAVIGGSLAKGTYLKGDHDVDVFVRFSPEYDDASLAEHLERVLKSVFAHVERVHGSRDYFHIYEGSFVFEFIPVLNISSWAEARNVTDMSPLHVAYVRQHIEKNRALAGDIRLTKQFCKAAKIYGAESYIGGFSGHVIDLLNIYYGGFHELLAAAARWPAKVIIDPEHQLTNPLTQLNDAKVYSPLIIVDPVQQDRNSAAAVSEQAFKKFRTTAEAYLSAKDREKYFTVLPLKGADLKKKHPGKDVLSVSLTPLRGKKDVVGAKCFKVYQYCVQHLIENEFPLIESEWEFTQKKATLFFVVEKGLLAPNKEFAGPPVHRTTDAARFQNAHATTFTREGKLVAVERRRWRDAKKLLSYLLKQPYVRERVKSAKT